MDPHKQRMRHSSAECGWRTAPALYAGLQRRWTFDVDLAATADNSLVTCETDDGPMAVYLGPDHPDPQYQDALQAPWQGLGRVGFLNPPYSLGEYSKGLKAGIPRSDLQYLLIENWARKCYLESRAGFTTIGIFPYAPQTQWFREYVMGHAVKLAKANGTPKQLVEWSGHAALDYWTIPHRVSFNRPDGTPAANANINTCVVEWGPNPGFVGPWVPSGRYWDYL